MRKKGKKKTKKLEKKKKIISKVKKEISKINLKKIKITKITKQIKYLKGLNLLLKSRKKLKIDKQIKEFLNRHMYQHKKVVVNTNRGKKIIKDLFKYLSKNPKKYISKELLKKEQKERAISDFIAGMTDRYAINLHKKIK